MSSKDIYQAGFDAYGESPKALHWISYASQAVRFKYLIADLDIEGKSVLDAGCGMGDVLPFLYAKADRFDYLGVDNNRNFIEVAKKRYSGHKFKVADPFSDSFNDRFDVVISSGVMNQNEADWQANRPLMIAKLFSLAKTTLAFNMAGSFRPPAPDAKIAYADARQILDYCLSLTPKVSLRTDYSNYDFAVLMHH
jgi:SAM-dependent methyltransferase